MSDWEPAPRQSRGAWRDRYGAQQYLEREQSRREQRDQALREYRQDNCHHGRVRKVGMNDLSSWAGLECREGKCPVLYLSAAEVFRQWRDEGQPSETGT